MDSNSNGKGVSNSTTCSGNHGESRTLKLKVQGLEW